MNKLIKLKLLIILSFIFFINTFSSANAEIVLNSLNKPIPIVIKNDLLIDKVNVGDPFSLFIPDLIIYKDLNLKTNTEFRGDVTKVNKTKRFNRNGYFKLHLKQMCKNESDCVDLDKAFKKPQYINLYQIDVQKAKNKSNLVLSAGKFVVGHAIGFFFPVFTFVSNESLAIYLEFHNDPIHEKPFINKVANGAWEGTEIPRRIRFVVKFCKIGPDPAYISGQNIEIRFKKKIMKKFLELSR